MLVWLYNKLKARYEPMTINKSAGLAIGRPNRTVGSFDHSIVEGQRPMQFTVIRAQGGHVVEFKHYDPKTDRTSGGLYIINDQDDFSKELANLVMMECLSR